MKKRLFSILLALALLTTSLAVYADADVRIVEQPTDICAAIDEIGTATVVAESEGEISYQWYFKAAGGTEWQVSGMPGAKTATISVQVLQRRLGQQYKCVLTDTRGESVETDAVTVVNADRSEIIITSQPDHIRAKLGENGSATVTASSDAALRYQWYFMAKNGTTWQASGMEGSKTATITVPVTAARLGQKYKCVIKSDDGTTVETDVVEVALPEPGIITIEAQPDHIRAKLGENGSATVTASAEAALRYQWYFKAVNTEVWKVSGMEGSKTPTITVPVTAARLGQKYKCVIKSDDGTTVETDVVEVALPEPGVITIEAQPDHIRAKLGENGTATVTASAEAALQYQWYFKAVNTETWKASGMEGSRTATITVPVTAARLGQQYKCVITAEDGATAETEVVEVKLPEPGGITIVSQPEDIVAELGTNGSATVEASAEAALRYQWYFKTVNTEVWKVSGMEGSKTPTITVPVTAARIGQAYKCVITAEDGGKAETAEIVIRKQEPVEEPGATEITIEEQDEVYAPIGENWSVTIQASAEAELSYQWYFKSVNTTEWKASGMTGCKTATITVPVIKARIGQQYKCVVSAPDGSSAVSQVFTIQEPPAEPEVNVTLKIVRNPDCYSVVEGQTVQLDVVAVAEESDWYGSMDYQWYRNGEPVAGGNERELLFYRAKAEQAGEYYCVVSVGSNTVTSAVSTVEVRTEG